MAHDVFISYSSKNKAVADAACATLEARGIRCWIAPRDVPGGGFYASALVDAISRSQVFVLILSEHSNRSNQVIREVDEAVGDGIPILPLRIDDVEPTGDMRYYVKSVHWLDAVTPPMQHHLDHLADAAEALLRVGAPAPRTPAPTRSRDQFEARATTTSDTASTGPIVIEGQGDSIERIPTLAAATTATVTFQGDARQVRGELEPWESEVFPLNIIALDANLDRGELLVSTAGSYRGTVRLAAGTAGFEIATDPQASWTIEVDV